MTDFPNGFPRRGEIYWAKLPKSEGSAQRGRRPVVIVSNDVGNQRSPVVIVAALTRTIPSKRYPHNVHLPANQPFPDPGTILANQLFTLDKNVLDGFRASLSAAQLAELNYALARSLALPTPEGTPKAERHR